MLPKDKLEHLSRRFDELPDLMCAPAAIADHAVMSKLTRERSELEGVVEKYALYKELERKVVEDEAALADPELRELVMEELPILRAQQETLAREIQFLLLPSDPNDKKNTILEIRSGEGGEEASLFAADLFRMYGRFAERVGWTVEILSSSESSTGGYKECIMLVVGKEVYSQLRFEGGVHRVQRVPATETQGRIHTSTATVAVLPEAEEVDVQIDEKDLQISIAASGGPGGQGVNTTNSAVQILHKPTGMIVKCQDERSQLKNKAKALKVMRSRLLDIERAKQEASVSAERKGMVGTAERSQKIRTYNYPQNRVTDHRIKMTLNKLDRVVDGEIHDLIVALRTHRQAAMLDGDDMMYMGAGSDDD
jgi:peptide chain release factor 1